MPISNQAVPQLIGDWWPRSSLVPVRFPYSVSFFQPHIVGPAPSQSQVSGYISSPKHPCSPLTHATKFITSHIPLRYISIPWMWVMISHRKPPDLCRSVMHIHRALPHLAFTLGSNMKQRFVRIQLALVNVQISLRELCINVWSLQVRR